MEEEKIIRGTYVPSEEEKRATYTNYISRIYSILVNYEAIKKINKDYINFLCFEIQAYGALLDNNELIGLASKISCLLSENISYSYVRKIVLDSTNFLSRLIKE